MNVDFDLRGQVGVRLLDAEAGDRLAGARQLGPLERRLERDPDVTIRFVDRVDHGRLTYVAWPDAAFDERRFYLLTGKGRLEAKSIVPFESLGVGCEIVCERGLAAVPLLLPIVGLTALAKGVLPLHASAFVHDGRGVLVTGWAKGGKSETLLAFMTRGARYVGDEWVYLAGDGQMFGVPEPIRLWGWQVEQLRSLAPRLSRSERWRLRGLGALAGTAGRLAPRRAGGRLGSLARRGAGLVRRQVSVQVPPSRLFGPDRLVDVAPVDAVVLASSHESDEVRLDPADGREIGQRMLASLAHERRTLLDAYRQFRFAFPDRRNELIERAPEIEAELIDRALGGRPAAWLRHPYPCRLEALFPPLNALLADLGAASSPPR
ncbi:MAG: hypothetical protein FIA92_17240 [Chloroflexi bacterium]|nr:hypothetical protein [Chloroflexota bacterium]